jgi:hypothetical protein
MMADDGRVWSEFIWLRKGPVAGSCEYGYEPSGSDATELLSYAIGHYSEVTF